MWESDLQFSWNKCKYWYTINRKSFWAHLTKQFLIKKKVFNTPKRAHHASISDFPCLSVPVSFVETTMLILLDSLLEEGMLWCHASCIKHHASCIKNSYRKGILPSKILTGKEFGPQNDGKEFGPQKCLPERNFALAYHYRISCPDWTLLTLVLFPLSCTGSLL